MLISNVHFFFYHLISLFILVIWKIFLFCSFMEIMNISDMIKIANIYLNDGEVNGILFWVCQYFFKINLYLEFMNPFIINF